MGKREERKERKELEETTNQALTDVKRFKNDLKFINGVPSGVLDQLGVCTDKLKECIVENTKGDGKSIGEIEDIKGNVKNFIDMNNDIISEVQQGKSESGEYFRNLKEFEKGLIDKKERIRQRNLGYNA